MNSFIVEFWARIFFVLGKLSLFSLLRILIPSLNSYRWIDAYVLGHTFLSLVALFIVGFCQNSLIAWGLTIYGAVRVIEINIYQINVLLFDEYRAKRAGRQYVVRGYRRLVLLLLHNYAEIIFWFACSYIIFADHFDHKWGHSTTVGGLYTSFIAMSTFGDFNVTPKHHIGATILLFQAASGLFMTLLSLARFIAILPQPETLDERESRSFRSPPSDLGR